MKTTTKRPNREAEPVNTLPGAGPLVAVTTKTRRPNRKADPLSPRLLPAQIEALDNVARDPALAEWLTAIDPGWNDGCT
jgi:hypothetical protein